MRRLSRILLLLAAFAMAAPAQHSNGYLFFAPGGVSCCGHSQMSLHVGGGGEAVLPFGIGIGAEIGALGVRNDFVDSVVGVFSPNGYFHFVHGRHVRADPYVTGGYTAMFRNGHINLFNAGGGLNYWLAGPLGIKLEFRDHIYSSGATVHYWGFRFGLAIR